LALGVTLASPTAAHPVPRKQYDRSIVVHLTAEAVVVDYKLDVDEWTAVNDLRFVISKDELAALTRPSEVYAAFSRAYGPILAGNVNATLDKQALEFRCIRTSQQVDKDHLHCEFVFRCAWNPPLGKRCQFALTEDNYAVDPGRIDLSLDVDASFVLYSSQQPDEAVKKRSLTELRPGDATRLRMASATFEVRELHAAATPTPSTPASAGDEQPRNLLHLLLNTEIGFWALMLLAAAFGAVHALTPGHGKTLVAAYLVGERGTVWHALFLGLVTTLTHTGSVLILAVAIALYYPDTESDKVQKVLGGVGGLLIAGLGVWLLMRRLSGGPDHVHIGGHGHHHHHHGADADHYHDDHGHAHPLPQPAPGWWGLIVLGVSGGIVPCWDAIFMLMYAIAAQRMWLGVPLLLAFSAGLAGVLVAIGIAVVKAKGFAGSHWGESRLFRALPLVSAALITVLGFWLAYDSLHPSQHAAKHISPGLRTGPTSLHDPRLPPSGADIAPGSGPAPA
jgi:ABC-type nickel/cobalt efflux system permease component RcnA